MVFLLFAVFGLPSHLIDGSELFHYHQPVHHVFTAMHREKMVVDRRFLVADCPKSHPNPEVDSQTCALYKFSAMNYKGYLHEVVVIDEFSSSIYPAQVTLS